jgi:hypothetical protein
LKANGAFPGNADLGLSENVAKNYSDVFSQPDVLRYSISTQQGVILLKFGPDQGRLAGHSIRYSPVSTPERLRWTCSSTVPAKYLPPKCRP